MLLSGQQGEIPMSPSLGSINLLEWLSVHQFIIKDIIKDTDESQMKYSGRGMWKGLACLLQGTTLPAPPRLPTWKLSEPHRFEFLQRLH